MTNKVYIGIDPGKSGYVAIHTPEIGYETKPIPTIGDSVDIYELNKIIKSVSTYANLYGYEIHAVIEDVHAIFGVSAKSTFNFGHVLGLIEMAVVANNIPYTKVQPKAWQKEMWQGVSLQVKSSSTGKSVVTDTKKMSQLAAHRLFPGMNFKRTERSKKDDDNIIDAVLMCEYCRRKF